MIGCIHWCRAFGGGMCLSSSMTIYCQMCKFSLLLQLCWYNGWGDNIFVELVGGGPSGGEALDTTGPAPTTPRTGRSHEGTAVNECT